MAALYGEIRDPRGEGKPPEVLLPYRFMCDKTGIVAPAEDPAEVEIIRGPNIQPVPVGKAIGDSYTGEVLIKLGDNVSTDHIQPGGRRCHHLPHEHARAGGFHLQARGRDFRPPRERGGRGIIVGAKTYGQGSAREQAAICPMILGVRAVIAKSFARIHRANLINWSILPLTFDNEDDYEKIDQGQSLSISNIRGFAYHGRVFEVEKPRRRAMHFRRGVRADGTRAAHASSWRRARLGPYRRGRVGSDRPYRNAGRLLT